MVDFILRHGNDLLAVECLRGYEVSVDMNTFCTVGGHGAPCTLVQPETISLPRWLVSDRVQFCLSI